MAQNYKNARKCHKCPGNNGEDGCPIWLELVGADPKTGKPDIKRGCGHILVPQLLVVAISAIDTHSASENGTRNVMAKGFEKLLTALKNLPQTEPKRLSHD